MIDSVACNGITFILVYSTKAHPLSTSKDAVILCALSEHGQASCGGRGSSLSVFS